jgi:hypothetical protein
MYAANPAKITPANWNRNRFQWPGSCTAVPASVCGPAGRKIVAACPLRLAIRDRTRCISKLLQAFFVSASHQ